ncbi:hypothetical protein BDC45DRAFT_541920 [Circinella umbellata]|nr:hypothetical protein BDC45DRAFT_541920 [Circinella umbellata]
MTVTLSLLKKMEEWYKKVANEFEKHNQRHSEVQTLQNEVFLRLLIRCRRVILQDAAVYLYFKKENSVVSSKLPDDPKYNPFLSTNFKEFQEVVSNRLSEMNYKLTRDQQKNNDRSNAIENSLNKHHQDSSRIESILLGLSQQLQQVSHNQKILLTNQQALNSQVQLLMAANISSSTNINENNQAQSPFSFGSIHSPFQPLPPLPIPPQSLPSQALSPLPHLTPTLLPPRPALPSPTPTSQTHPHPQAAIQPIASLANSIGSTSHSSTSKGKKRGRWVNYSVQHSP